MQAGHAMLRYPAGHDSAEMAKIRRHIQRHAMPGNPARDTHTNGANLRLLPGRLVRDPNANPAFAPFALHAEMRQRPDHPIFQPRDKGAHIARRNAAMGAVQIKHHIPRALPRPVIGPLPASPGLKHREAGIVQILSAGRSAGGVAGRVFHQPHSLRLTPRTYGSGAAFHACQRLGIGGKARQGFPFKGGR